MKKLVILLVLMATSVAASAQWSVGVDARLAPFGHYNSQRSIGTDISVNYTQDFKDGFFMMPSLGLFYKSHFKDQWDGGTGFNIYYQTGFDITVVFGKQFECSKGSFSIYTGPRYAYAYATKTLDMSISPNSLDWRIGIGYSINKITLSLKADIGCLKTKYRYKNVSNLEGPEFHSTTFALGVAYNF